MEKNQTNLSLCLVVCAYLFTHLSHGQQDDRKEEVIVADSVNTEVLVTQELVIQGFTDGATDIHGTLNADRINVTDGLSMESDIFTNGHWISHQSFDQSGPVDITGRGIYIAADGRVGVGVNDPQTRLHVNGLIQSGGLRSQGPIVLGSNVISYDGNADGLRSTADGKFAIGDIYPLKKLHVDGGIKANGTIKADLDLVTERDISVARDLQVNGISKVQSLKIFKNLQTNGHWLSYDGTGQGIYIDEQGKVGIGTDSPNNKFTVDGNTKVNGQMILGTGMRTDEKWISSDGSTNAGMQVALDDASNMEVNLKAPQLKKASSLNFSSLGNNKTWRMISWNDLDNKEGKFELRFVETRAGSTEAKTALTASKDGYIGIGMHNNEVPKDALDLVMPSNNTLKLRYTVDNNQHYTVGLDQGGTDFGIHRQKSGWNGGNPYNILSFQEDGSTGVVSVGADQVQLNGEVVVTGQQNARIKFQDDGTTNTYSIVSLAEENADRFKIEIGGVAVLNIAQPHDPNAEKVVNLGWSESHTYINGDMTVVNGDLELNGAGGPDYVFAEDYDLLSLKEVEQYINEYHHLPRVRSAAEFEAEGLDVKEISFKLLEKVEELTLYTIEQQHQLEEKAAENLQLNAEVNRLKAEVEDFKSWVQSQLEEPQAKSGEK